MNEDKPKDLNEALMKWEHFEEVDRKIRAWQKEKNKLQEYLICYNLIQNLCLITGGFKDVNYVLDQMGHLFFTKDEIKAIKNIHSKKSQKILNTLMPVIKIDKIEEEKRQKRLARKEAKAKEANKS